MISKMIFPIVAISLFVFSAEARRDQVREVRQEARVVQGVKSGELNKAEAHRLHKGQKRVDRAQASAMEDGTVTDAEKAQLEKMQDIQNKRIYEQKHDEQQRQTQPGH